MITNIHPIIYSDTLQRALSLLFIVKTAKITHSVSKIYIKRRISGFHRIQIDDKPSCPSVSVNKRINKFKPI